MRSIGVCMCIEVKSHIQGVKMLTLFGSLCCDGFTSFIAVLAGVRRQQFLLLGPSHYVLHEGGDRIQSPKRHVFK
jgi:hypothetical protein